MNDRIEKQITLNAPVSKVWQALTDHKQFGEWFGVKLEGPFTVGKPTKGKMTVAGYEGKPFEATTQKLTPETFFSYSWHPGCSVDKSYDLSKESPTLVEFTLIPKGNSTLLQVVETGFSKLPAGRSEEAYRGNTEGWGAQLNNIANYVNARAA